MDKNSFISVIENGYTFEGDSINLGAGMLGKEVMTGSIVKAPLKTFNRHGLIAGATGTGKTKTMQNVAEALSMKGVPTILMDIKGDISGISQAATGHHKIDERHTAIGLPWEGHKLPVEFLTISDEPGTRLRGTVSEFGPVMLSKMLELNGTQGGMVAILFKYCDDNSIPLLDLKDFKKTLQYLTNEGKEAIEKEYGNLASTSTSTIMRKVVELESQGGEKLFGEPSFEINDFMRLSQEGYGYINVIRLMDMQTKPKLFSTFMLTMLAEVYQNLPEVGNPDKPKLVMFIDEAHLLFNEASPALMDQLEVVIKLIRSKGVGIFFVTQNPVDIPNVILGQLGMKIQHALRAFTAKDRKAIKLAAENYPETEFYKVEDELTLLGTGEAFVSVLNEKGIPTPLAHTMMTAPVTRMDIITDAELNTEISKSVIKPKYDTEVDRESAYEILNKKIETAAKTEASEDEIKELEKVQKSKTKSKKQDSIVESLSKNTMVRQLGRTATREVTRSLLGLFKLK